MRAPNTFDFEGRKKSLIPIQIRHLLRKFIVEPFEPKTPAHICKNIRILRDSDVNLVKKLFENNDPIADEKCFISNQNRLEENRKYRIPWLDSAKSLKNAKVLEIGCGYGSSTIALAEQGAKVTAIDINPDRIAVNKNWCKIYGLTVNFLIANATEVANILSQEKFDFIIFWASLEHMTLHTRRAAIKSTWDMCQSGAFWCMTDTPNRLWPTDFHYYKLPFFYWLTDDLAIEYLRSCPQQDEKDYLTKYSDENLKIQKFYGYGRGVSFHEFELALSKSAEKLDIVSSMTEFWRKKYFFLLRYWRFNFNYQYESLLHSLCPNMHIGFFQKNLDLIIRKD